MIDKLLPSGWLYEIVHTRLLASADSAFKYSVDQSKSELVCPTRKFIDIGTQQPISVESERNFVELNPFKIEDLWKDAMHHKFVLSIALNLDPSIPSMLFFASLYRILRCRYNPALSTNSNGRDNALGNKIELEIDATNPISDPSHCVLTQTRFTLTNIVSKDKENNTHKTR